MVGLAGGWAAQARGAPRTRSILRGVGGGGGVVVFGEARGEEQRRPGSGMVFTARKLFAVRDAYLK